MQGIYTNSFQRFTFLVTLFCLMAAVHPLYGQDEEDRFVVQRIKVVDRSQPVFNIHVDEDNVKWIANANAVYRVSAKDQAEPTSIAEGEQSLLQLPGGNIDIRWRLDEMKEILGDAKITTAAYEAKDKMLWIGTDGYGVFKVRIDNNGLQLVEEMWNENSKLRSDFINSIYISPKGKLWIATEDGALVRTKGGWDLVQRYFNIQRIAGDRTQTWAIGDDLVWIIDARDNWTPIEINMREIEGFMHDIALDDENRIWIASNIMTSYNLGSGKYEHFGPGQYFTSQFVNYVSIDDDGTIWVGTDDKGVYILEKASTITVTPTLDEALACDGSSSDATASVRAIGGTPPYEISWSTGATGETASGLGPGLYTITVTDALGSSKSAELEILDPFITVELLQEQQESDEGAADAIVSMTVNGGVPGYNAKWSHGPTGAKLIDLTEGEYSVTVTDQAGCTAESSIVVTREIFALNAVMDVVDPVLCSGGSNGGIHVKVDGGRKPYTYQWSTADTSQALLNLTAGTYSVTVTDAEGSTAVQQVELDEPEPITGSFNIDQPASTGQPDGSATIEATGGAGGYSYKWPGGVSGPTASGLEAGDREVIVTDQNGCTAVIVVSMSENILPINATITETVPVSCPGTTSATLAVEVTGGKGPYTYLWSTGQETDATLEGVGAGNVSVTITDATGQQSVAEYALGQPQPVSILLSTISPANTGASDGSAQAEVSGGTPPYTYDWGNGETDVQALALAPGKHIVTVSDANGCTATGTLSMSEDILPLEVALSLRENVLCAGESDGAVVADINGGKGPFTYSWSTGQPNENEHENLPAGQVSVTVTDAVGTTAFTSMVVEEPSAIALKHNPGCACDDRPGRWPGAR